MATPLNGLPSSVPPARLNSTEGEPRADAVPALPNPKWDVKTEVINGVPRRVEMRMPTDAASLAAQDAMPIACPVLKALKEAGKIQVDANGRVQTREMLEAFKEQGLTGPMLEVLRGITYFANEPKDIARNAVDQSFNVMHLRSGMTMHNADSNVLSRGEFDEEAFKRFAAQAKDGYLDESGFAAAIADQTHGDMWAQNPLVATAFGKNATLTEYPVLLQLLNTKDPNGNPAVSVEALKAFWKDGTLPSQNAAPGSISLWSTARMYASMLLKVDGELVKHAFRDLLTATGLAETGLRLSKAFETPSSAIPTAAAGAAKAVCPYMKGGSAPANPLSALDVHIQ